MPKKVKMERSCCRYCPKTEQRQFEIIPLPSRMTAASTVGYVLKAAAVNVHISPT
ncbi:MAG: hypothetical protein ACLRXQ_05920 [Phascolarctobacterium faecium]